MEHTKSPHQKPPHGRWALPNPTRRSPRPVRSVDPGGRIEDTQRDQGDWKPPIALPIYGLGGDPKNVLTKHTPDAISVLFWSINNLVRLTQKCEDDERWAEAIAATNCVARNAKSILDITVGKKQNISISSQEQIPKWEDLPEAKRQKFLDFAETVNLPTIIEESAELVEGALHDPSVHPTP